MPQESISRISNRRHREFESARDGNNQSETSIPDDRKINIGEFYGCLCHQAPRNHLTTRSRPATDN
jgi:hypothetical protein